METDRRQGGGTGAKLSHPVGGEEHSFVEVQGELVYVSAHHPTIAPRAQVFLCPPFGIERTLAYTTLVRTARSLAAAGYQVVRFDYRSMGESSGRTETLGIPDWIVDARTIFDRTRSLARGSPRCLAGLRFGAFVAGSLFAEGLGDGLLALAPDPDVRTMLMALLRRKVAENLVLGETSGSRVQRSRSEYLDELQTSGILEVDGYLWGRRIWDGSGELSFPLPAAQDDRPAELLFFRRPPGNEAFRSAKLEVVEIPSPPFWSDAPYLLLDSALEERILAFLEQLSAIAVPETPSSKGDLPRHENRSAPASMPLPPDEDRRVFTCELAGQSVVGTVHRPVGEPLDTAVVLFNGGQIPRNGHGSVSAKIGSCLARRGVAVYRLDLPGLGDSPGDLPSTRWQLFRENEAGHQAPIVSASLHYVKEHFGHPQLVAGGLCGAASNAVFVAGREPSLLKGVLMLEAQLFLMPPAAHLESTLRSIFMKLRSRRSWIGAMTSERSRPFAQRLALVRKFLLPLVTQKGLAHSINLPLVTALAKVCNSDIPVLSITCRGGLRETYIHHVEQSLLSPEQGNLITDVSIPDTNHIFTSGRAIDRLIKVIETWLDTDVGLALRDEPTTTLDRCVLGG